MSGVRIALVSDYYLPTLGGVQTVVKAHREALTEAGHEVTVFAPLAEPSTDPGVVALPVSGVFRPDGFPFAWPPAGVEDALRAEFASRRIEVVHVHSEMFAALGGFGAARTLGLPVVQTMHGRVDVYTRHVLPMPALTTVLLAALHGRRLPHGPPVRGGTPYTRTRLARRMWRLMVSHANAADHVIVPSRHFAAKLLDQGVTTPVSVLSNGLEASVLDAVGMPAVRRPHGDLRVMWCGRMSPEKRPEVFVDAVAATPGVRATLYGDGMALRRVRRRAARANGRIVLRGSVPQADVLAGMRAHDVFVSSSYDFDNQPMVMLEAVASGLPVVHLDPDLAEVVPDGGGLLAASPDAAGLAATLAGLRDAPARVAAMSEVLVEARGVASQERHLAGLLDAYEAAIRRHQERRSAPGVSSA